MVELGVLAHTSDQNRVGGLLPQHHAVGETAVDDDLERPLRRAQVLIQLLPQKLQPAGALGRHRVFAASLPILLAFLVGGVDQVAWPPRRGRVLIVDGDGAGRAELVGAGQGRDGQHALGADEVGVKGRSQRIAAPSDAGDFRASFGQQRIVHGDDQRRGGIEFSDDAAAGHRKERVGVEAGFGKEAIDGRPILEAGAAGVQHTGDGAAAQPHQSSQHQGFDFLLDAPLAGTAEGLVGEGLEGVEEPGRRVCFRTEGGACGRLRPS